jgi:hypothetical protein
MSEFLEVRADDLEKVALVAGRVLDESTRHAMKIAIARVSRWAGNEVRRKVASAVKVKGGIIKGRMFVGISDQKGRVWLGLSPIKLNRLNPRQTASGVTAGPAKRPGAFIVEKFGGNVFERKGKARLPIEKSAGHDIRSEGDAAMAAVKEQIGPRLLAEFERALKWGRQKST